MSESNSQPPDPVPRQPIATLEEIDILPEFESRPQRVANYAREHEAMSALALEMAENPHNILQRLTELALELCRADTVGISILTGDVFRWDALAGELASRRNSTIPRSASPCGVCTDRNATQLMSLPELHFPALRTELQFFEMLLIPFQAHAQPIGTIWVAAHNPKRKFDREDERIIRSLGQFASAGWQLQQALEAAREANHKKDEFIAVLSHELRNPVSGIRMNLSTLAMPLDETRLRKCIERLERQTNSIARIVDDIRDLSRLVHRKVSIEREQIDLKILLQEVQEEWQERLGTSQVVVCAAMPESPVVVLGDRIRLTQVFDNLLANAVKFTTGAGRILLALSTDEKNAIVKIIDTGRGFDPAANNEIFNPFVQHSETISGEQGSMGLGLAISRQLIELLGGTVTAHSDGVGLGATFTIVLPHG
jgi:signal transduction histidine kinase